MASSDVLPRFFTVFLSQYSSESMVIPRSYYQHLPRRLPKTAILVGTGGRFWKVAMTSRREQVYFEQGWGNFVADNELKDGEFLTFVFDGHRSYEVSIYGRGDCKETRAVIQVEEISDDDTEDYSVSLHSLNNVSLHSLNNVSLHSLDNDSLQADVEIESDSLKADVEIESDSLEVDVEIESDSDYSPENLDTASISVESVEVVNPTRSRQRSYKKKTIENPTTSMTSRQRSYKKKTIENPTTSMTSRQRSYKKRTIENPTTSMTSRQKSYKKKTIENPELYLDDPNNICFETCLKLRKSELLVDAQFVKDYSLKFGDKVDYIDGYGKLTATMTKWADQRICIKKWSKICDRNSLTENDSILCEVLRNEDKVVYAIKIHIFRDAAAASN
ncbi:B3 DNA binding domain [Arabidopsis thaliana x Arabidopsis arenosa]|uniref:B3 DNA binding domain n=1 Tax=Arabidopsis thaliana x Arabidopsis arenosa TaxID=1240361 RepID=A0A8T2AQF1_9BRAS|nr:B3 DNA binding domain [Arabidopsis thaliana x Arabidopsis arenosa]